MRCGLRAKCCCQAGGGERRRPTRRAGGRAVGVGAGDGRHSSGTETCILAPRQPLRPALCATSAANGNRRHPAVTPRRCNAESGIMLSWPQGNRRASADALGVTDVRRKAQDRRVRLRSNGCWGPWKRVLTIISLRRFEGRYPLCACGQASPARQASTDFERRTWALVSEADTGTCGHVCLCCRLPRRDAF